MPRDPELDNSLAFLAEPYEFISKLDGEPMLQFAVHRLPPTRYGRRCSNGRHAQSSVIRRERSCKSSSVSTPRT